MRPDERLAQLAGALEAAGIEVLVLGGHAVRYYGIDRNTVDFDFYTSSTASELRSRVAKTELLRACREGPSWRPSDFVRFEIGRLSDGREEWLEFWLHNHLLPEFAEVRARQERGLYGGRNIGFISLSDLIRSKETERESDWQDISLLEEVQDTRLLTQPIAPVDVPAILSNIRSRRGFKRALQSGLFDEELAVRAAIQRCWYSVSFAYLCPRVGDESPRSDLRGPIDPSLLSPLATVEFGSERHFAICEIIRRAYRRWAMDHDRKDKQAIRQEQRRS